MAYADYSFYQMRGGQMSAPDFLIYSEKASDYIDYITFEHAKTYDDTENRLKKCCCALVDEMKKTDNISGKSSESIGSYSVSFSENTNTEVQKRYGNVCRIYIGSTGLMYRGV